METRRRIGEVIGHIEARVGEHTDYAALARIACMSEYNLRRVFASVTGYTIADYIRRRRMTRAAEELRAGAKVIDVALRCGYDPPEAFVRAFRTVYKTSPSAVRRGGVALMPFPRISVSMEVEPMGTGVFREIVKGMRAEQDGGITVAIVRMEAISLIGKIRQNGVQDIAGFWHWAHASGFLKKLYAMQENFRDFGLFLNGGDYMIGIERPERAFDAREYDAVSVPEGVWVAAYGRFGSAHVTTPKCWRMANAYCADTEYEIDPALPVIEKYPDGAEPLDQTYLLMKPLRIRR